MIMKKIIYVLLLLPLTLYVIFVLFNWDLLSVSQEISLFAITTINGPLFALLSVFIIIYILLIWVVLKFSNFFIERKDRILENQINELKGKLHDNQKELLDSISSEFRDILSKYQKENYENIQAFKSENQKVVSNVEFELKNIKDKISKIEN